MWLGKTKTNNLVIISTKENLYGHVWMQIFLTELISILYNKTEVLVHKLYVLQEWLILKNCFHQQQKNLLF